MFDILLKFSKTHSQTVIAALVGIVAVGAIGGGFMIHGLQATATEEKALCSERLQAATARDSNRLTTVEGKQEGLNSEVGVLRAGLPALVGHIATLKEQLFSIPLDKADHSKEFAAARVMATTLSDDANSLTSALASADAVIHTLDKVESRWQTEQSGARGGHDRSVLVVLLVLAVILGFFVGRAGRVKREPE